MNKKRSALIVAAIVLIAAAGYGFWYYQQQQDQPLTLYGNVDIRTVNLGFRVDGRLASLTVDEGDPLQPGQLLGKLDDAPYINALQQAQLNLHDTTLISPSAGTVLTRAVEPGTMLSAGGTVFTLSLTRPVWVRAYVNESSLGKAVPGAELEIYTDGRPNRPYHGKIGFVSPTAEFTPKSVETPDLRTDLVYRLRVIVTDADDELRQGMPVTVRFAKP